MLCCSWNISVCFPVGDKLIFSRWYSRRRQMSDLQYGRKRYIIRYRTEHPKGARTKSRTERVVDLHQPETLQTVSDYVMHERPTDAESPYVFLVGGRGKRRCEPLSYHALVKLFERHCNQL